MSTSSSVSILRKYSPYSCCTSGMCSCVPMISASQAANLRASHANDRQELTELGVNLADVASIRGHDEQLRLFKQTASCDGRSQFLPLESLQRGAAHQPVDPPGSGFGPKDTDD